MELIYQICLRLRSGRRVWLVWTNGGWTVL
jgi:hypothetical protein